MRPRPRTHGSLRRNRGTDLGAFLHALLTLDTETDERGDLASELYRLVLGQVAEVHDLDLALRVLVDRERVDHADGVALAELLELLDDLPVEVRVLESEHDELDWPELPFATS